MKIRFDKTYPYITEDDPFHQNKVQIVQLMLAVWAFCYLGIKKKASITYVFCQ